MSQCEKILKYIEEHGSISGLESILQLGVINYRGRISDLRQSGVQIEKKMVTETNAAGERKTFARYYLA